MAKEKKLVSRKRFYFANRSFCSQTFIKVGRMAKKKKTNKILNSKTLPTTCNATTIL
jgi:hypothetical protein